MPRRSARLQSKVDDEQINDVEMKESKPKRGRGRTSKNKNKNKNSTSKPETMVESVSNAKTSDDAQETEQKEPSEIQSSAQSVDVQDNMEKLNINQDSKSSKQAASNDEPEDVSMTDIDQAKPDQNEQAEQPQPEQPENVDSNEMDPDDEEEDESMDDEPGATIAVTRSRRNVTKISYRDESSSEEEDSEDSDDADNPIYAGLSKQARKEMRAKMAAMQTNYDENVKRERQLKIQEIIGSFDLNIGATVTEQEAGFMYDFCRKHQYDIIEKIEEEGDFFLMSMREMMEEKMKLIKQGILTSNKNRKKRGDDDSESEFDMNDFEDSDDSEYSMDSDWDNPLMDNENLISEDEDDEDYVYGRKNRRNRGGRRRRNRNTWRDDSGREYYSNGRLLLVDALKDTENFEGWSAARVRAWKNKDVNPNAYYYRFNDMGEEPINGAVRESEHKGFMERVKEFGVNAQWGLFSKSIPGRVGYQCSNYWRQMMKDGWVKDPNYWIRSDGSFQFKRSQKGKKGIPDDIRKYAFVVLKDPSGVFDNLPAFHPKRPSDSRLARFLEKDVAKLTEKQKKGGKRGKAKAKKEDENVEEKGDKEEVEDVGDDENGDNVEKKTKEKKDKKSKKKKGNKGKKKKDENVEDEEDGDDEDKEGKKKSKKKKKSSKKKKDKKSEKKKDKKSKKKDKKKKNKNKKKKDEEEVVNEDENEKEGESETAGETAEDTTEETSTTTTKGKKRGRKRKRNGKNGEVSELEPPQKKRKIGDKDKDKKTEDEQEEDVDDEDKENEGPLAMLHGVTDIMTGDKIKVPAISPYGYVMEYNSWCSILRNKRTKNKCPFTKKPMTRRQLVKLDESNIEEYKDKIVNITDQDMKNFNN